jgi:hypothetical protein
MLKQKITILLVTLICISFLGGLFTVICHGSDGHVAIETSVHSHCECPETDQNNERNKYGETTRVFSVDHEHCKHTTLAPNVLIPIRKNIKPAISKIFIAELTLKPVLAQTPSFFGCFAAYSSELSSFYTPLRSIILLA